MGGGICVCALGNLVGQKLSHFLESFGTQPGFTAQCGIAYNGILFP